MVLAKEKRLGKSLRAGPASGSVAPSILRTTELPAKAEAA